MVLNFRESGTRREKGKQNKSGMGENPVQTSTPKGLSPTISLESLKALFPAVKRLEGMDQRSKYHSLTADRHTEEVDRNLQNEPEYEELSEERKAWSSLAAKLHDVGKGHPDGREEKDDGTMDYSGHEGVSARIVREEIITDFDISDEGKQFVVAMVEHHGVLLRLINAFDGNDQPKGKKLAGYENWIKKAVDIPGSETEDGLMKNLRLMVAFTRADKKSAVDSRTESDRPDLAKKRDKAVQTLGKIESALPAIVEAVKQKKKGVQEAGIARQQDGSYVYKNYGKRVGGPKYDMKALGTIFREKGIHMKALGIIQKTSEAELPAALEKAGLGEHVETIQQVLAEQTSQ